MKTYEVIRTVGAPDWQAVPSVNIETRLWSDVDGIHPSAQVCWDEDALYVRLQTLEEHILRRFTGDLDMVCLDSCLEFFFRPENEGDRYLNFECNPNGSLYLAFGRPGSQRCRLYRSDFRQIFQLRPFDIPGGWGIELKVPVSFVRIFVPEFQLHAGLELRGNFFKCGDETVAPHYMAWNPVEVSHPNFHLPEFFGRLILK